MNATTAAAARPRGVERRRCALASTIPHCQTERTPRRSLAVPAAAPLALALWLLGSLFFMGDLGKWTDDYAFCNRDPVTGRADHLFRDGGGVVRRPLMLKINSLLQTVFWERDPVIHVMGALVHAAAVALSWVLLRMIGSTRTAAATVALVFMTYPAHYQVVFWSTAIPIGLGAVLMLLIFAGCVLWARRRHGWWVIPGLAAACFALTCMYEQPGAAMAGLPLLYLACCPRHERFGARILRAASVSIPCWAAVGTYVVLYRMTMPPDAYGQPDSMWSLAEMPAALDTFARQTGRFILLRNFKDDALVRGAQALGQHPARSAVLLVAVLVGSLMWVAHSRRTGGLHPDPRSGSPSRPLLLAAFGLVAFAASLMPVLLVRDYWWPDSRMLYTPAIGLAVMLAAALGAVGRVPFVIRARHALAGPSMYALSGGLVLFAVMQIGAQAAMRERFRLDSAQACTLRSLMPDPPHDAVFAPLDVDDVPEGACWRLNHVFVFGIWSAPWTTIHVPQRLYRRTDVYCCHGRPEGGTWNYAGADERCLLMRSIPTHWSGPAPYPADGAGLHHVPWAKVIPFIVDRDGRLRLVTHVVIEAADGRRRVVPVPATLAAARRGDIPPLTWRLTVLPP